MPDYDLKSIAEDVIFALKVKDADPEAGHARIDALCETVVYMVAAGHEDAYEAAQLVKNLLDVERAEDWIRWYA